MKKLRIYVASSWRNKLQQATVKLLRDAGHEVYDFKNPPNGSGFSWSEVHPDWQSWSVREYRDGLGHWRAVQGYKSDFDAMKEADVCVLVLPCGRSAHSEAGYMCGTGKPVIVFMPEMQEPELMYKMFYTITGSPLELVGTIVEISRGNYRYRQS